MKLSRTFSVLFLLAAALCTSAQRPMKAPAGGKAISDELIGIFFEDISSSADGGLYAELIQNGSFEYNPTERNGWGPATAWTFERPGHSLGRVESHMKQPLNDNNPTFMRIFVERVGHYYDYDGWTGVGLQNNGFDGISVKGGAKYDFSAFFRNSGEATQMQVRVALVVPQGWGKSPKLLADTTMQISSEFWIKKTAVLTPSEDATNAALQILVLTKGNMDIDFVSLMPQDTETLSKT